MGASSLGARSARALRDASVPSASGSSWPSRISVRLDPSGTSWRDLELDRLQVAFLACGLESELLKLARDIIHRLAEFVGADIAALQFVVGQELDVRPPESCLRAA